MAANVGDLYSDVLMPEAELVGDFTTKRSGATEAVANPDPTQGDPDVTRHGMGERFGRRVYTAVKRATRPIGKRRY